MSLSPCVSCENGEWAGSGQTRVMGPKYHVLDGVQIRSPTRAGLLCKYVRLSCVFYNKLTHSLIRLCDMIFAELLWTRVHFPPPFVAPEVHTYKLRTAGALICIHRNLCSFSSSGLTPRISRTVYRYFWAYPFFTLSFFLFPHFLVVGSVR